MSGGSFNYLYCYDTDGLFDRESDLEDIYNALKSTGYSDDEAKDTFYILRVIQSAKEKIEMKLDEGGDNNIQSIWYAMEWWKSSDTSEDDFIKALEEYRESKLTKE